MRILAWNVNHRARPRHIPEGVAKAIIALTPDVVVLTEYVLGRDHERFIEQLAQGGLVHRAMTPAQPIHNQVLIASRFPLDAPSVVQPSLPHASSNLLHVAIPAQGIEVVGLRVPMYKTNAEAKQYWDWFVGALPALASRCTVVIGDLNADPQRQRGRGTLHLSNLLADGCQMPTATGEWSYRSSKGFTSRLDHALVSPTVRATDARYVTEVAGFHLAVVAK